VRRKFVFFEFQQSMALSNLQVRLHAKKMRKIAEIKETNFEVSGPEGVELLLKI